jgi:crossover junction endodeoxyribonuclease RuvC
MKIMGIDPGTSVTGVGIIDYGKELLALVGYCAVRSSSRESLPRRLKQIYDAVVEQIQTYKPEVCAVEEVFGGKNIRSTLTIGQARGAAIMAAINSGIEVVEYTPAEVKISLVGNGNASKEQVQYMVQNLLGLKEKPFPLDCSDALAVALCHSNRIKFSQILEKNR